MSGHIRQGIAPIKTKLIRLLEEIPEYRQLIDSQKSHSENLQTLHDLKFRILYEKEKLERTVQSLQAKNDAWIAIIERLEGENRGREEEIYKQYNEDPNSFIYVTLRADDKIADLTTKLTEIEQLHETLNKDTSLLSTSPASLNSPIAAGNIPNTTPAFLPPLPPNQVRLPKLQLPIFSGNKLKFKEFWDTFESSIDVQPISNVQKFQYLKSMLRGEAFLVIEGMAVTNENYEHAKEILKSRYGDPSQIKQALYKQLNQMPLSSNRLVDLTHTADSLDRILRQLHALGEQVEHPSIVHLITRKYPADFLLKLQELLAPSASWTVESLSNAIRKVLSDRAAVMHLTERDRPSDKRTEQNQRSGLKPLIKGTHDTYGYTHITQTMASSTGQRKVTGWNSGKREFLCVFCDQRHSGECQKFPTLKLRRMAIQQAGKCYICLKVGHFASTCELKNKRCRTCQSTRHHPLLCPKRPITNTTPSTRPNFRKIISNAVHTDSWDCESDEEINQSNEKTEDALETPIKEFEQTQITPVSVSLQTAGCDQSVDNARLLVAKTQVSNPNNVELTKFACIFFDCGSQRTFIVEEKATELNLPILNTETLTVYTFCAKKPLQLKTNVVQLGIPLRNGELCIVQARTIPRILTRQDRMPLSKEDQEFLQRYPQHFLADKQYNKKTMCHPDVLIGGDYFWKFIEPAEKVELPSGLFLIPSKVGMLISGAENEKEKKYEKKKLCNSKSLDIYHDR